MIGLGLSAFVLIASVSNGQEAAPKQQGIFVAAKAMDQYLQSLDAVEQSKWKQHFNWDAWGSALARDQVPDREALEAVLPKFYGFLDGLDQAEYLRMRSELKSYLQGTEPPAPIGVHPSFYVRMDKDLIDSRLDKKSKTLEVHRPTGNYITGAWVTGDATSLIDVKAQLANYQNQAAIEVRIKGTTQTPHTVATSGRFHVHGSATTQSEGVAYVLLDKGDFRATEPQVVARTESQLSHVDGPRPFRRIAIRQAHKRQPQGEMEGAEIVRTTVEDEFKQELAKEVASVNEKLADYQKYWRMLKRADIAPTQISTALIEDTLQLGLRFSDSGADSAHASKPRAPGSSVEITMHETFLSAFPRRFLKGVWWKAEDFEKARKDLAGIPIDPQAPAPSLARWSARWDSREPITMIITPEHIECRLAFSHAGVADQWINEGIFASAKFRPIAAESKIELRRIDPVVVQARSPNAQFSNEMKLFLERQFTHLCGDAIPLQHLNPPAGLSANALALFTTTDVTLEQGWMNISYRKGDGVISKLVKQTTPTTETAK